MKICIVGGGTAGWLTALFIAKIKPWVTVTVIESVNIPIIGAGEGSTGALVDVVTNRIWNFDCNEDEFLRETGATLKYGIMHKAWTPDLDKSYFGPLGGTQTSSAFIDYSLAYGLVNFPEKLHLATELGLLLENNLSNFDKTTFSLKRSEAMGHALHFDAHLVGKYFKKVTLKSKNANLIEADVVDVTLNETGNIKSLLLDNGNVVEADFFVDATGFKRMLMSKLETKWVSYKKNLPVNSALPFIEKQESDEYIPEPYTSAWAQKNGWMWTIPQQRKRGCGYVFCDDFTTPEKAQEEIELALGRPIDPIRVLKFDTGRLENTWVKNCLAIGLCAAFAEPLEATSIHTTVAQLIVFVFEFLKTDIEDTLNPGSIKMYNHRINTLYDDLKDFLVMHYMGGRTDSEFWRYISEGNTQTEKVKLLLETSKTRIPSKGDIPDYLGAAGWGLWSYVIDKLDSKLAKKELESVMYNTDTSLTEAGKIYIDELHRKFYSDSKNYLPYSAFVRYIRK
jgi:Tryptophan halogenase